MTYKKLEVNQFSVNKCFVIYTLHTCGTLTIIYITSYFTIIDSNYYCCKSKRLNIIYTNGANLLLKRSLRKSVFFFY